MATNVIPDWINDILRGSGGLEDFKRFEMAVPTTDHDYTVAAWVIRCLANPRNKKSRKVLKLIAARRKELKGE